jgi:hypothetical protein
LPLPPEIPRGGAEVRTLASHPRRGLRAAEDGAEISSPDP